MLSGSYVPSTSSSLGFPDRDSHLALSIPGILTLCIMSGYGSLFLFPSAAGGNSLMKTE